MFPQLLKELGLHLVSFRSSNWQRYISDTFDFISDEPYSFIEVLFNPDEGQCLTRVWGNTISNDKCVTDNELQIALRCAFTKIKPCLGFDQSTKCGNGLISIPFPFRRNISKECLGFIDEENSSTCSNCDNDMNAAKRRACDEMLDSLLEVANEMKAHLKSRHKSCSGPESTENRLGFDSDSVESWLADKEEEMSDTKSQFESVDGGDSSVFEPEWSEEESEEEKTQVGEKGLKVIPAQSDVEEEVNPIKGDMPKLLEYLDRPRAPLLPKVCVADLPRNAAGRLKCSRCTKTYADGQAWRDHQNHKHLRTNYLCLFCAEFDSTTIEYPEDIESHVLEAHPDTPMAFCRYCRDAVRLGRGVSLFKHMAKCKKERDLQVKLNKETDSVSSERNCKRERSEEIDSSPCKIKIRKEVNDDEEEYESFQDPIASSSEQVVKLEESNGDAIEEEQESEVEQYLPAESNSKRIRSKRKRTAPVLYPEIFDGGKLACDKCTVLFDTVNKWRDHLYHKHMKYSYCCNQCEKVCNFPHEIEAHVLEQHPGQSVECPYCQKDQSVGDISPPFLEHAIACKALMRNPMTICTLCGKEFTTQSMVTHMISIHHQNEKALKCDVCGKMCKNKYVLYQHKARHGGKYKCTKCDKSYGIPFLLKKHMSVHASGSSGSFACSYCGKTFSGKKHLEGHESLHTDSPKHVCKLCGTLFVTSCSHQKHLRRTHGLTHEASIEETKN